MILQNVKPFTGQHCETTTIGTLLYQQGIELSEPMLFGLGEGLGYIFWNMKTMDFPFIGGRIKPDLLTDKLCQNLNLDLKVKETGSVKKAWTNVQTDLDQGKVVGLKLDCYHLEYFNTKIHFAGHYVAMYGYDDAYAYLVDTDQQGREVKTTLNNLQLARNEKGSMSSRNRSYTIHKKGRSVDIGTTIKQAISNNAKDYLNPPITNFGYKGIKRTATEIKKWFKNSSNVKHEFQTTATIMERAGTGGALFRNLYRDFLTESADLLDNEVIKSAADRFKDLAEMWTLVAVLLHRVGETENEIYVNKAASILEKLSVEEKAVMEKLLIV